MTNLFLISYISKLLKIDLYTFEHNTIPEDGFFKSLLQRMCLKNVSRICYTPKAVDVFKKIGQRALYIPHPAIKLNVIKNNDNELDACYKKMVFCPSGSSDLELIKLKAKEHSDFLFVVKSNEKIKIKNVLVKRYFNNYGFLIENADFVYLPVSFSSRVSGPFFEALAHSKIIIVNDNDFGRFVKSKYPNNVCFVNEHWFGKSNYYNDEDHNNLISNEIKKHLFTDY